jgi:two-component system, sensor histidine kinase and response regulator
VWRLCGKDADVPPGLDDALSRLDGDRQLLRELALVFIEDVPKQRDRLHRAIAVGRSTEIAAAAHSLKGAVANFDSGTAFQCAASIEAAARLEQSEHLHTDLARLDAALDELVELLRNC